MTKKEIKKFEDLWNETGRCLVACEDRKEEIIHYMGKRLGILLALDILGYKPKESEEKEVYLQKGVKPVRYSLDKIVKKEE